MNKTSKILADSEYFTEMNLQILTHIHLNKSSKLRKWRKGFESYLFSKPITDASNAAKKKNTE